MAIKEIPIMEILKDLYDCVENSKYKGVIQLDYIGKDDDVIGLKIMSNKKLSIEESNEIMDIIYNCIESRDPNLIIHFEWG